MQDLEELLEFEGGAARKDRNQLFGNKIGHSA
jgi:hypothetical protein